MPSVDNCNHPVGDRALGIQHASRLSRPLAWTSAFVPCPWLLVRLETEIASCRAMCVNPVDGLERLTAPDGEQTLSPCGGVISTSTTCSGLAGFQESGGVVGYVVRVEQVQVAGRPDVEDRHITGPIDNDLDPHSVARPQARPAPAGVAPSSCRGSTRPSWAASSSPARYVSGRTLAAHHQLQIYGHRSRRLDGWDQGVGQELVQRSS